MRVLGLDPGTRKFGWASVESRDGILVLRSSGIISAKGDMPMRIAHIWTELKKLWIVHYPEGIAIEAGFIGRNAQTGLAIAKARTLCDLLAGTMKIPVEDYAPAQIKKAITSTGKGSKADVMAAVNELFKLTDPARRIVDDDQSDAIAVAVTHLNKVEGKTMLERMEAESLLNLWASGEKSHA